MISHRQTVNLKYFCLVNKSRCLNNRILLLIQVDETKIEQKATVIIIFYYFLSKYIYLLNNFVSK